MKKSKAHALWNGLSPEQREILDKWLFDDGLSYAKAWPRAQAELGFKGSISSLKRYCKRRSDERTLEEFQDLRDELLALNQAPADPKTIHAGATKLMGRFLFRRLKESPEEVEKWAPVANLLMQNNHTEMLREAKAREHDIREDALAFAKEKFKCDTTEKALRALPQLRELAEARKDPQTKQAERSERLKQIKWMMFGDEGDEEQ
jgi:hypothetical protein